MSKISAPDEWEERDVVRRLFVPDLTGWQLGDIRSPDEDEQHYAVNVLRLAAGDTVELFDGRGHQAKARVEICRKRELSLVLNQDVSAVESPTGPVLAVGYCKRFDQVLEKATELGAELVIPLRLDRTAISLNDGKLAHFEKIVLAAARQSGRYMMPQIAPFTTLENLLDKYENCAAALPHGCPMGRLARLPECLLIGPEGGFSPAELALLREHGVPGYGLAPHILRVETAALASLAAYWQVRI